MITSKYIESNTGTWPVSLAETKLYLRVSGTGDDTLIQTLIDEACRVAQGYASIQLCTSLSVSLVAIQGNVQNLQNKELPLSYPNSTITITSITLDGDALTVDDDYEVRADNVLELKSNPLANQLLAVNYTAAIATTQNIKVPILKLVADAYENRSEQSIETLDLVKKNAHFYLQSFVNGADLF